MNYIMQMIVTQSHRMFKFLFSKLRCLIRKWWCQYQSLTFGSLDNFVLLFVAPVKSTFHDNIISTYGLRRSTKAPVVTVSACSPSPSCRSFTAVWERERLQSVSTGWGSLHRADRCAWPPSPSLSSYTEAARYSPLTQLSQQQSSRIKCRTHTLMTVWTITVYLSSSH